MDRTLPEDGPIIPGTDITYDFPDLAGRLQLRKIRWQTEGGRGKTFRMWSRRLLTDIEQDDLRRTYRKASEFNVQLKYAQRWQPTHRHCPNAHELLYGLPDAMQAMDDGVQTIYWCEGEKDVNSLRAADEIAVSHWQGAANATPEQAEYLVKFAGTLVLVADADPPGAADVLRRWGLLVKAGIPEGRIRLVRPPGGWSTGKDVSDHLEAGLTVDRLVEIKIYNKEFRAAAKQFEEERGKRGGYAY